MYVRYLSKLREKNYFSLSNCTERFSIPPSFQYILCLYFSTLFHCLSNLMSRTYFVFIPRPILLKCLNIINNSYRPMFTFNSSFLQHFFFSYSSNFLDVDLINFHIFIPSFKYTSLSSVYIIYCNFLSQQNLLQN